MENTIPKILQEKIIMIVPGARTPSEATQAHRAGADFVKLFPISRMGASYIKAVCAPLSHIRFLAVGGVNGDNMADFIASGACGVGMGVGQDFKDAPDAGNFAYIEKNAASWQIH